MKLHGVQVKSQKVSGMIHQRPKMFASKVVRPNPKRPYDKYKVYRLA